MRIYRYRLEAKNKQIQEVEMPVGSVILDIENSCRPDIISVWALVNPDMKSNVIHQFLIVSTGEDLPESIDSTNYKKTLLVENKIIHILKL